MPDSRYGGSRAPQPKFTEADVPEKYRPFLTRIQGGVLYMTIPGLVLMLRDRDDMASIETYLLEHTDGVSALFKATVSMYDEVTKSVVIVGTGHAIEYKAKFTDYLEKAETSAIGRAIRACGIGTEFSDEGNEMQAARPVDAPLKEQQPVRGPQETYLDPAEATLAEERARAEASVQAERSAALTRLRKIAKALGRGYTTKDDITALVYEVHPGKPKGESITARDIQATAEALEKVLTESGATEESEE